MTNIEVVQELRQRIKPFLYLKNPKMSQSTFSIGLRNAELRLSKESTLIKFFGCFGYQGTVDNWILKPGYLSPAPTKQTANEKA